MNPSSADVGKFLRNHAAWFAATADSTMPGKELPAFSASVVNRHGHITISADPPFDKQTIDRGLNWIRESSATRLLIWADQDNRELDIVLASRGVTDSFCPRWMLRDLMEPLPERLAPESIQIERATVGDLDSLQAAAHIPYVDLDLARKILQPNFDASTWMLIARDGESGPIVGHLTLFLTNDGSGWGGVYGAGVQTDRQRRGIGSALTLAACRTARDHGLTHLSLNATPDGERAYRKVGFRVVGDGRTWFMELRSGDPGPDQATIEWAERLAHGKPTPGDETRAVSTSMPNGDSPLAFAARFKQADAARWLIEHGAMRDIPALAQLKLWPELEVALGDPALRNAMIGPKGRTPLHLAVLTNNRKLVSMLLEVGADTTITDGEFGGTALGWANHLGRHALARMIEQAVENQ